MASLQQEWPLQCRDCESAFPAAMTRLAPTPYAPYYPCDTGISVLSRAAVETRKFPACGRRTDYSADAS
jgi:hypothetical protein